MSSEIVDALEEYLGNGVLHSLRAQLVASIFQVMQGNSKLEVEEAKLNQSVKVLATDLEGRLALQLVNELLVTLGLANTQKVFLLESGLVSYSFLKWKTNV